MDIVSKPTMQNVILQEAHGKLVGFMVGIDDYDKTLGFPPLKTCSNDAIEVRNTLEDVLQLNADKKRLTVLTSKHGHASRGEILKGLSNAVDSSTGNDKLLFYFSGHGYRFNENPDKLYLVPQDVFGDKDASFFVDFKMVMDILTKSPAKLKLVILDACFSGTTLSGSKSHGVAYSPKFLKEYLKKTTGIVVIGSSTGEEESFTKSPDPKLSLFTYYLIMAFRGEAAALHSNKWLSINSLYDYVSMAVQQTAKSYHKVQSPTIDIEATGTILLADFGKLLLPSTNLELGEYPVSQLEISENSSRLNAKTILTSMTRPHSEWTIVTVANKVLPEYLQEELSKKASQIVKALKLSEAAVNVDGAGIIFPGGSYFCEYIAIDKKTGFIQNTLTLESHFIDEVEKIPLLIDAVEIHASSFVICFNKYFEPIPLIPGLKPRGWEVESHCQDKVVVSQSGYKLTIEISKITFSGFSPRELFGNTADDLKTALAVGVLSLIK